MAFSERSLDDYVDVAERIAEFRDRYPDGSLQPADPAHPWEQATISGVAKDGKPFTATMVVYAAAAYRHPDDPRPGIGCAWEPFPGRTPYTLGSELMNAETSAWGRAIIAVLAADSKRGVASRQEVRNRRAERPDGLPTNKDGSLSRSRTTDEEKDAAGAMTSAQQREHTALRSGAHGRTAAADRGRVVRTGPGEAVPGDVWSGQPPGESAAPPEDQPGSINRQQRAAMHAAFGVLGVSDREERLAVTSSILERTVTSSADLSYVEAGRLLEGLNALAKAEARG